MRVLNSFLLFTISNLYARPSAEIRVAEVKN